MESPIFWPKTMWVLPRKWPLHYPKECPREGPVQHPCVFCGKEEPDQVLEDCPIKDDKSQKTDIDMLFHQCVQFQWTLMQKKICYICRAPDLTDGHIQKCLSLKIVSATEGWAPLLVRVDTVVGSGLPMCYQCSQARPLHYPGDCNMALYESDLMPCLICGGDDHIPEDCTLPGTSIVGCETLRNMVSTHLIKLVGKGQCYICKAYHLPNGKYEDQHFPTTNCLHSLLATGKMHWDRKESMLAPSKDHHQHQQLPKPKRQRGPDGRPIVKKPPEKQWTVKILDKVFEQLKDW